MKNAKLIITLLIFSTLILSCGANRTELIAETMDEIYINMPVSEFKEKVEDEELIEMNKEITIYRKVIKTYNRMFYGVPIPKTIDYRYFYFVDNKLVKVDEGERAVDYRIKIENQYNEHL